MTRIPTRKRKKPPDFRGDLSNFDVALTQNTADAAIPPI
jgi:hypothetical protein